MAFRKSRKSARALTDMVARFRSPSLFEFAAGQGTDLAKGGMFIRTDTPAPIGTLLKLECEPRLQGQTETIRAIGRVVWARTCEQPSLGPPGMGVKFVKLEADSEALIRRVLEERGSSLDPHGNWCQPPRTTQETISCSLPPASDRTRNAPAPTGLSEATAAQALSSDDTGRPADRNEAPTGPTAPPTGSWHGGRALAVLTVVLLGAALAVQVLRAH